MKCDMVTLQGIEWKKGLMQKKQVAMCYDCIINVE